MEAKIRWWDNLKSLENLNLDIINKLPELKDITLNSMIYGETGIYDYEY